MKKLILLGLAMLPVLCFCQVEQTQDSVCIIDFWGIEEPDNDCEPCINDMQKLLEPLIKLKRYGEKIGTLNQTMDQYFEDQQAEIDRLTEMQNDISDNIYNWNINDLNGGSGTSDPSYISNYIERELETYKNRFGEDYPYINTMMDNWISELENLKEMMDEDKAIDEKAAALIRKINSGFYGDFGKLNFNCCPEQDPPYDPDQLAKLDELLEDLGELFDEYFEFRSKMVELAAHYTEMLKTMLLLRAAEEGRMEDRQDEYSDGLFAFLIGEMVDGMKTALSQSISDEGLNLNPEQQAAVNAFAEKAGPKIEALISGGATELSSALVGDIIKLAGADMSENDREALASIGGQIWGAVAEKVVEKAASKLLEKAAGRFALQGLGSIAALPITLWEQLITVPLYLWAGRDLEVMKGTYDRAVIGLLIAIKLSQNKSTSGPAVMINAYINALKTPRNKAIVLCLPESDPNPTTAEDYARIFTETLFGEGSNETLSGNDHYDLINVEEGSDTKCLHYVYNNQLRIKVRIPCYCGKWQFPEEEKVFTPDPEPRPEDLEEPPNIWERIELASKEAKLIEKAPFPWWIPITGGLLTGGGITTYFLTREGEDEPTLPVAISDNYSFPCQSSGVLDVLQNDTGDGITITSLSSVPSTVDLINNGSNISMSNSGRLDFNFKYTITDIHGQSVSAGVFVSLTDDSDPVITCPPDIAIACGESYEPLTTGSATATDNCSESDQIIIGYADDLSQLENGSITRTWTATDQAGNSVDCKQIITISDTQSPVITCPPDATVNFGETYEPETTGYATATDDCTPSDKLAIEYTDDLSQLENGTVTRTWTATDQAGNASDCHQIITISDTQSPVITCPPDATVNCGESYDPETTGYATATDDCTPSDQLTIEYTDDLSQLESGTVTRTWTATDQAGNASDCNQIITINDTQSPVITCPPDATVNCGESYDPETTGYATATDDCTPSDQLTIEYTDDLSQLENGTVTRTWTATDQTGNASDCNQLITISDTQSPVITCPPDATVNCGDTYDPETTGYATATDDCTPSDQLTIEYTDDLSQLENGTVTRTWTATDQTGNASDCHQIITISDTQSPVITCPPDATVNCGESYDPETTGYATATDDCTPSDQLTIEYTDDLSQLENGTVTRTWTATDQTGNASDCNQIITISDTQSPVITCPPDATVNCGESYDPETTGYATATDDCTPSDQLTIEYTDDLSLLTGCNETGTIVRQWTATDASGNTSMCESQIFVQDEDAPQIDCPPDITIGSDDGTDPDLTGYPTVSDNCTPETDITFNYTDDLSDIIYYSGVLHRTWTATDACGLSITCLQDIIIEAEPCSFTIDFVITNPDCGLENGMIESNYDMGLDVSFYWSNGETGSSVSALGAGTYQLTITEAVENCESFFEFELTENDPAYISSFDTEPTVCPNSGNITLTLESPGDGIFTIHILGPELDETIEDLEVDFISLNDYFFIGEGDYIVSVFDQSMGENCAEELELNIASVLNNALTLVTLNQPDNADLNNGSAVFSIDISLVTAPYDIYVNGVFHSQIWEPGFILENLTVGEYAVFIIDANGCQSESLSFVMIGTGFNYPQNQMTLGTNQCSSFIHQNMLLKWSQEALTGRGSGEMLPLKKSDIHVLYPLQNNTACISLEYEKMYSGNFISGITLIAGKTKQDILIFNEIYESPIQIPLDYINTGIRMNVSKKWEWQKQDFLLNIGVRYDQMIFDNSQWIPLLNFLNINEQDVSLSGLSLNLEMLLQKQILQGVQGSIKMGGRLMEYEQKWTVKPYALVDFRFSLISY